MGIITPLFQVRTLRLKVKWQRWESNPGLCGKGGAAFFPVTSKTDKQNKPPVLFLKCNGSPFSLLYFISNIRPLKQKRDKMKTKDWRVTVLLAIVLSIYVINKNKRKKLGSYLYVWLCILLFYTLYCDYILTINSFLYIA